MRAFNVAKAAALALSVAFAAGCSTTGTTTDTGSAATDGATDNAATQSVGVDSGLSSKSLEQQQLEALANLRTVFYFDFDKSTVQADGMADLEGHARYLSSNPNVNVRLDGHTDERGTREYNLALGERRANSVLNYLIVNGASRSQIEVVSYGEERPAQQGQSENAYSRNRRVEVVAR
jgi:peptidoglycan-associated lipoprotein